QLTTKNEPTIMRKPGNRGTRVNINPNRQDVYDRIRPQGGRGFRALQPLGSEHRRDSGKRDGGTGDLFERRSGAGGANPFLECAANGGGKALQVRGFSGNTSQKFLKAQLRSRSAVAYLLLFLLLPGSVLLSGCGHKPTQAQVPPPPALP